ncbi:hypothetical protein KJ680_13535 [bacterium]|nr:hypothetical protein [bacterium]
MNQQEIDEKQAIAEAAGLKGGFPEFMWRSSKYAGRTAKAVLRANTTQNAKQDDNYDTNGVAQDVVTTPPSSSRQRNGRETWRKKLVIVILILFGAILTFGLFNKLTNTKSAPTPTAQTEIAENSSRFGGGTSGDTDQISATTDADDTTTTKTEGGRFGTTKDESVILPESDQENQRIAIVLTTPCLEDWGVKYPNLDVKNTYDCPGIQFVNWAHPNALNKYDWQEYLQTTDVNRDEWICLWRIYVDGENQFPLSITYPMLDACGVEY